MILLSEVSFWALGSLLLEIFVGLSSPLAYLSLAFLTSIASTSLPLSRLPHLSLAFFIYTNIKTISKR